MEVDKTIQLFSGKNAIPDDLYQLNYLEIICEFNRIPTALIRLAETNKESEDKFKLSNEGHFDPGKELKIKTNSKTLFQGIITKLDIKSKVKGTWICLALKSNAVKLTTTRQSMIYKEKSDTEIIKEILKDNSINIANEVDTIYKHKEMIQYYTSDWDFIMNRLQANGLFAYIDSEDGFNFFEPKSSGDIQKKFSLNQEKDQQMIDTLEANSDIITQHKNIESLTWNPDEQAIEEVKSNDNFSESPSFLEEVFDKLEIDGKPNKLSLINSASLAPEETKAWVEGRLKQERLSLRRYRVQIKGESDVKLGNLIEIDGLPNLFNGNTIVTGLRTQMGIGGSWTTQIQLGLPNKLFTEEVENIMDVPAAGLLPGIQGLHIGIVAQFQEDPEKKHRVPVNVLSFQAGAEKKEYKTVWARLASLDAGNKRGIFFRPEPNDTVILGFINEDPRQAVILGSIYTKNDQLPFEISKDNAEKGIVTREGLSLCFNDKEQKIECATSEKNKVILDEKNKTILINNEHNQNTIEFSKDGIVIKSGKNLEVTAGGDILIEAGGEVKIKGNKVDVS